MFYLNKISQAFKSISVKIKTLSIVSMLFVLTCLFSDCKREVLNSQIETNTFIRTFPAPNSENGIYLKRTDDNGFMLFYNDPYDTLNATNNDRLCIQKFNAKYETEWVKKITSDKLWFPMFIDQPDGSTVFVPQGQGKYGKLDANGDPVYISTFQNNNPTNGFYFFTNSYPLTVNDTFSMVGFCDGSSQGSPSDTYIQFFGPLGQFSGYVILTDNDLGFKTLNLCPYKCEIVGDYLTIYVFGWCYPNWSGDWASNRKIYYGKIMLGKKKQFLYKDLRILEPQNHTIDGIGFYQLFDSKKQLFIIETLSDLNSMQRGKLTKIDEQLNVVFRKDILIGENGTSISGMSECADGTYLMFGNCYISGRSTALPWAGKVSSEGDIIWSKIFPTTLTGSINWGIQMPDGSCLFTGQSNSFANGKNLNDVLLIKTDRNGNVK